MGVELGYACSRPALLCMARRLAINQACVVSVTHLNKTREMHVQYPHENVPEFCVRHYVVPCKCGKYMLCNNASMVFWVSSNPMSDMP